MTPIYLDPKVEYRRTGELDSPRTDDEVRTGEAKQLSAQVARAIRKRNASPSYKLGKQVASGEGGKQVASDESGSGEESDAYGISNSGFKYLHGGKIGW